MNNQMQQFGDGGLKDEGGEIDEVSGNEVPVGGTKEGVRDDIPANVSEGEFIFPEDVVRFIGLDKLMSIRQDAKMGLKKMDAMGQMGNGDEASMPDDMPFDMTDIIVVGDNEQPMEFAGGGFIPVEDYTVVQDMIEDRSDKAAAIDKDKAMSDMIADNTTKSAVIDKENEIQNFSHGGTPSASVPSWITPPPQGSTNTMAAISLTNPVTGEVFNATHGGYSINTSNLGTPETSPGEQMPTARKKLTFKEMMGDQYAEILVYSNEAGDKIVVPAINGVPIYAPPEGYTLYVPPVEGEEEEEVGEPLPPEAVEAIQTINNNNSEKERPQAEVPEPKDWAGMSSKEFIIESRKLTGTGRNIMEAVLMFIPFVGLAARAMLSHQDRTVQAIMAERITNGDFSAEQKTELGIINTSLDKSSEGIFGAVITAVGTALSAVGTAIENALTGNDVIVKSDDPAIQIVQSGAVGSSLRPKTRIELSDAVETDLTTSAQMEENRLGIDPDGIAERAAATKKAAQDAEIQRMLAKNKGTSVPLVSSAESDSLDAFGGTGPTVSDPRGKNQRGTNVATKPSAINKLTDGDQTLDAFGGTGPTVTDPRDSFNGAGKPVTPSGIATTEVATSPIVNTKGETDYYSILPVKKVDSQGGVLEFIKTGYNYVKDVVTTAAENNDNYNENARRDREAKAEAAALEAQKAEEAAAAKVAQAAEIQRMLAAQQAASNNNNNNNNNNDNFAQPTQVTQATRDKINTASDNLDKATVGSDGTASTVREDAGITFKKSDNDRGFTGGLYKGGLASKPKAKKKTTNKRGLAARK